MNLGMQWHDVTVERKMHTLTLIAQEVHLHIVLHNIAKEFSLFVSVEAGMGICNYNSLVKRF